MATGSMEKARATGRRAGREWQGACKETWWAQHREASLNWLALGLLLAAWNATDNDPVAHAKRQARRAARLFLCFGACTAVGNVESCGFHANVKGL